MILYRCTYLSNTHFYHTATNYWTGKTTTATLIARESGRDVIELNASDARSKKALGSVLGDVTGSQVLSFDNMGKKKNKKLAPIQKRCIIMDEVDGMGAGDRSGMSELIQMIKKSKVPIVSDNGFDIVNDIMCLANIMHVIDLSVSHILSPAQIYS